MMVSAEERGIYTIYEYCHRIDLGLYYKSFTNRILESHSTQVRLNNKNK